MRAHARPLVVVCESRPGHGDAVANWLGEGGYDVCRCAGEESLILAVASRRPRAVVYELCHALPVDLAILALLRTVLPHVPLVLLTCDATGPSVRALRGMRPAVIASEPVGREGLHDAVRTAVRRGRERERRHPTHA